MNKQEKNKGRMLVIGDIHGNAKGLTQVLEKSGFNNEIDTIIQLGDVADGWSETSECVDILLGIKNLISIRGNHDIWVEDWFNLGIQPLIWTQQGGQATINSYINSGKLTDQEHKQFWNDQQDWYIDEQDRLFIHAGWAYKYTPPEKHVGVLSDRKLFEFQAGLPVNAGTNAKECNWDRSIIMGAASASHAGHSFKATAQFKEVYIGHTASKDHSVHQYGNLWNMDSGSGWYGRLSIMDIDTKEIWYADYSKDLYPNEKGR